MVGYLFLAAVILLGFYNYITGRGGGTSEAVKAAPKKVSRWIRYAKKHGNRAGIPWQIIMAIIWQESRGNPNAVGSAGEVGLMQLKPDAVEDVQKFTSVSTTGWQEDEETNIKVGANYLEVNLRPGRADGDLFKALRMYNQGPTGALSGQSSYKSIQYAKQIRSKAQKLGYDF